MSAIITKRNNNEYIITDENNQVRNISFLNPRYYTDIIDNIIMDIIYRETELEEIENEICKLEKNLTKDNKQRMIYLIQKYGLLEQDLNLIKDEYGFIDYISESKANSFHK